ncbi:MAG: hypothetical protein RIQ54_339 [Candidatus Parcubacteria bacterium]|jgi:uncharacterized membrane protein
MTRLTQIAVVVIIALLFAVSWYAHPIAPDQIAIHWNAYGDADGFASKAFGLFMMPALAAVIMGIVILLVNTKPSKQTLSKVSGYIDMMVVVLALFFLYMHVITVAVNVGVPVSIIPAIIPAFSLLFFVSGVVMKHVPRNYVIGIRTPWSLESDGVWKKTHEESAWLFQAAALIGLGGLVLPQYAIWFVIIPAIGAAIGSVGHSFWVYRNINTK